MKIKSEEEKEFELVYEDGDIVLEVDGKCIVQFIKVNDGINMWTNFEDTYKKLKIIQK